jgi:hypothetical protein
MKNPVADEKVMSQSEQVDEWSSDKDATLVNRDIGKDSPRVKAIRWRVDLCLSAILALMYIVNQVDRANLPNA